MNKIYVILSFLLLLILPGCWDRGEIEDIGFVLGVGLDPLTKEEEQRAIEQYKKETGHDPSVEHHQTMFKATYQLAVPGEMKAEGGQGDGKSFSNITTLGMTNFRIYRMFAARNSGVINLEHLKVLIIHQKLARQGMMEHLIDFFIRDHQMRRRTHVFIAEEEAKEILDDEHPLEKLVAESIDDISENNTRYLAMSEPVTMGRLSQHVIGKTSYIVPRIVHHGKGGAKIAGAAVFLGKTNNMIGWLGEEDIRAYNWIMEAAGMGLLEVFYEDEELFSYENFGQVTSVDYERKDDQDVFHIEVRTEGAFVENWIHKIELTDQETLEKLETAIGKRIEEQITKLMTKMQEEFHADIFEFHTKVYQKDPSYWKKVKDKWDGEGGVFSKAEIQVEAKVKIRHYMLNEQLAD